MKHSMSRVRRLKATSLEAELTDPGRTVSRSKRKLVERPEKVLGETHLSVEEVEIEVGECEEWDKASFEREESES